MPRPEDWFVRDLKLIGEDFRVSWGQERYGVQLWVIERHVPADMYGRIYAGQRGERYIDQKLTDADGQISGGRRYDMMPEWEWVMFARERDGSFRPLDQRTLYEVKVWLKEYTRVEDQLSAERAAFLARELAKDELRRDRQGRAIMSNPANRTEGDRIIWETPYSGQPERVMPGTEI